MPDSSLLIADETKKSSLADADSASWAGEQSIGSGAIITSSYYLLLEISFSGTIRCSFLSTLAYLPMSDHE